MNEASAMYDDNAANEGNTRQAYDAMNKADATSVLQAYDTVNEADAQ